ncbi:MAG: PQQ-binding-like beta-propeller repeat protein, partial [Vicinamibacteria bacterium]
MTPGLLMCAAALAAALATAGSATAEWPQWRGLLGTGMALGDAPLRWDDSTNVRWKLEVAGRGHSTPVVAGDRLFLTTAVPTGRRAAAPGTTRAGGGADAGLEHRFEVIAVDRRTGTIAWQRTATVATPHEGYHR